MMMAEVSQRSKAASRERLNCLSVCKKAMMIRALEKSRARKKVQQKMAVGNTKRKSTDEPVRARKRLREDGVSDAEPENGIGPNPENVSAGACQPELPVPVPPTRDGHSLVPALGDSWDVDSGFSSEASPPASGRSSPSCGLRLTPVVALDCEMVGTGPKGRCSELARCSILDYHGNVLYDKYVRPCQPVTDYRTRWSGIRKHHLLNATPFTQAREEILGILEGKVVVGHSIHNDFRALDMTHPYHLVRDTITTRLLKQLADMPNKRLASLKILASKLLKRRIQVGTRGHCSVEDARAALDLYKLVEGEWEQALQDKLWDGDAPREPSLAASNHYMHDKYWPDDVTAGSH